MVDSNGFVSGRLLKSLGLSLPGLPNSRYKLTPHIRRLLFGEIEVEKANAEDGGEQESRKRKVDEIIIDDDDEDAENFEPARKKQKRSNKNPFVDSEAEEDED